MNFLFFIPARKNSKGIKNKNISKIKKQPLIFYTLNFVKKFIKKNKLKEDIFYYLISSDSEKILNISKKNGFNTNYKRPKRLSQDNTTMVDTVKHALNWLEKNKHLKIDTIIILQPTTPLRYINELTKMILKFKRKKLRSMISVTRVKEHPYEIIFKKNSKWNFLQKSNKKARGRQDYDDSYFYIDGSYYILDVEFFLKQNKIIIENYTDLYLLERSWPIDIDIKDDLKIAEVFL